MPDASDAPGRCEATRRAKCRAFMNPERIEVWTPADRYSEVDADIDPDLGGDIPVFVRLPLDDGGDLIVSPDVVGGGCYAPRENKPCVWFRWEPAVHPMQQPEIF